ncbi:hypothetical protein C8R46DRAFT_533994 [Mycena filopes]|nr:hypothetical protein C8R46DRAFT_533994 [Mycena filopes]
MATSVCVASWTASLPYNPLQSDKVWNTTRIDMAPQKPRLRLATTAAIALPTSRFDPFADEEQQHQPRASTSQNTPPPPSHNGHRGRPLTPLTITVPAPAPAVEGGHNRVGRRRAPSFSAGTPRPASPLSTLSALSTLACAPSPAPSLTRVHPRTSSPSPPAVVGVPDVEGAPTPFHARHYPTPDARARLLARTLLNRIHAVGRPRAQCGMRADGYESECGGRGYTPSRLSECVSVAVC